MGEGRGEEGEGGTGGGLSARKAARKKAYNRACEDAFSHILLLVAPGRRAAAMVVELASFLLLTLLPHTHDL